MPAPFQGRHGLVLADGAEVQEDEGLAGELGLEGAHQDVVNERALAASRHAGDRGDGAQWDADVDALEAVLGQETRRCALCGAEFVPDSPLQDHCSISCRRKVSDRKRAQDPKRKAWWRKWKDAHTDVLRAAYQEKARREREAKRAWREMYPGAHLPSTADAVRARGLCARCRAAPPIPGKTVCRPCADRDIAKTAARYAQHKAAGLCIQCGTRVVGGGVLCPACSDRPCRTEAAMVRRCRELGAKGEHNFEAWHARFALFGYRCAWCGKAVARPHRDHVIPLAKGGTNWAANIVPSCGACNISKSDRHPREFVRSRMSRGLPVTRYALNIAKYLQITASEAARPARCPQSRESEFSDPKSEGA